MSTVDPDGGQVFPVPPNEPIHGGGPGITLRDHFASVTMHANITRNAINAPEQLAKLAYIVADAMLSERLKQR